MQPGPSVMRGLTSGTPTSSQQQSDMQKMQSQPSLMSQQYQPQSMFRGAGANQNTRPPRAAMVQGYGTPPFLPLYQFPGFPPRMGQWNYGSIPTMPFAQQYFAQPQHIIPSQHQQSRRNPGGENNLVNMSQVQMSQAQPNQQSSPMGVSHDLLVMQQMHPQPTPQHSGPQPGLPPGAPGQAPMEQHQPNPAQVNVGAPQPHHTLMPQLQLAPHLPAPPQAAPAAKVNKKRQRGARAIAIINPDTLEDVLDKYYDNDSTAAAATSSATSSVTTSGPPPSLSSGPAGVGSSAPPPPSANYSTIPPNGTPELPPGGMLLHHQGPPHMHHPPTNHPPQPPAHVHAVPNPMYEIGRTPTGAQQPHELVYPGQLKTGNPPPHLPPPSLHHGVVPIVPTAAEMTTASGTPVVSANANAPSVEIKPYQQQKKKKPISEPPQQMILQQPPPPVQHPIHHQHPLPR